MGPASTNLRPLQAGPPKLTAFVKALEATGGKPFAPLPVLRSHLSGVGEDHWVHDLPERVTAKVLRVGSTSLDAALVFFAKHGGDDCEGAEGLVAVTAVEHTARPGLSQLYVRRLKTQIRAWFQPKVVIPPHYKKTRAFFVAYQYDDDLTNCPKSPVDEHLGDSKRALFKLGKRRLVQYSYYNLSGNAGSAGSRINILTRLKWHVSKAQADRIYLSIVTEKRHRVFNTAGEQKYEEFSCSRSVSAIAMEPGKLWNPIRGPKLARLRKTEPEIAKLPKKMRGGTPKVCRSIAPF